MEHLEMKLINDVMAYVRENPHSKTGKLMAEALWSACTMVSGPSLLAASVHLDYRNSRLFARLARITEEPDFNNVAQDRAMDELRERMGYGKTYHSIPIDAGSDARIEVYGDGSMGWYEWRLMKRGQIEHDTRQAGYGNPDVALRDALCYVYGPPDELEQLDQAIGRAQRGERLEP